MPYARAPLVSRPGETFQYSNGGYMLLAQVIAKAGGKGFPQFLEEEIFAPLGMSSSGCDRETPVPGRARKHDLSKAVPEVAEQPTHIIVRAGDAYSMIDDLLRWDVALYGDRLPSARSREAMFAIQHKTARGGIGYGWFARNASDGTIGHYQHGGSGAGFVSFVVRRPKDHVNLAVLANLGSEGEFQVPNGCRGRLDAWLSTNR